MNAAVATRDDIDEVIGIIRDFMQAVDNRFNSLEFRLDNRIDGVEERLNRVEKSQDNMLGMIDGLSGRIDTYEIENAARDAKVNRLTDWARKSSKANHIPLEDL